MCLLAAYIGGPWLLMMALLKSLPIISQCLHRLQIMPVDQLRAELLLQLRDHLGALHPRVVVPCQPAVWVRHLEVLFDMELVSGPDEGAVLFEVYLHGAQAGRVAGGKV
jgi:hypothetical protein